MNEYDMIFEELCERVECGELTLEEAELINDVAYDKYVSEGNTFNKLVKYHADEADKATNKAEKYRKIRNDINTSSRVADLAHQKFVKYNDIISHHDYNKSLGAGRYVAGDPTSKDLVRELRDRYKLAKNHSEQRDMLRHRKQRWMHDHGNTGKTPEERYKAGRYL